MEVPYSTGILITKAWRDLKCIFLFFNFFDDLQGEIHHVLNPNPYRGAFGSDAKRYAEDVQDHIDHGTSGKVAGFIAETIQVWLVISVMWQNAASSID